MTMSETTNGTAADTPTRNSVDASELRTFIDRIERTEERKQAAADDIKAIYAEAKARGYSPKYLRHCVKARRETPSARDDDMAMRDLYESAAGLKRELPLFAAVARMGVDRMAQDSVVEALKHLVPHAGEITVTMGGKAVRLWRDKDGEAHSEDVVERPMSMPGGEAPPPARRKAPVPDCGEAEAEEFGREAFRANEAIIANPFPWDDARRARWDFGWRKEGGSDGMGPDDE